MIPSVPGCPRGQPQLSDDGDAMLCDMKRKTCAPGYECTRAGGSAVCCPTTGILSCLCLFLPEMICSYHGGLSSSLSVDSPPPLLFHQGSNRAGQPTVTRWYWDTKSSGCRPFKYLGQGGNWNNFVSEESCLSFCDRAVCSLGQPLRDASGGVLRCGRQAQCPSSHTCNGGYCCLSTGICLC